MEVPKEQKKKKNSPHFYFDDRCFYDSSPTQGGDVPSYVEEAK